MENFEENFEIKNFTTFGIGGCVKRFSVINSEDQIASFFNEAKNVGLRPFILGGGSNIIVDDSGLNLWVAKIEIKGIEILKENDTEVLIKFAAGENWDEAVKFCAEKGFSGIEAMAKIPGTVGAAPVQNIGAYGQEIKDSLVELNAYNSEKSDFITLSKKDCEFLYRNSIFKERAGRYLITDITLKLSKNAPTLPDYPGVKKYFEENKIKEISTKTIYKAISEIRKNKLPDPNKIPNSGSFFKNPYISKKKFEELKNIDPLIPGYPDHDLIKVPAGYLIEKSGLKGHDFGKIIVYEKNALVLTNPNRSADFQDLIDAKNEIIKIVKDKFDVTLEMEPQILTKG